MVVSMAQRRGNGEFVFNTHSFSLGGGKGSGVKSGDGVWLHVTELCRWYRFHNKKNPEMVPVVQ
jgi:hypothetical protein